MIPSLTLQMLLLLYHSISGYTIEANNIEDIDRLLNTIYHHNNIICVLKLIFYTNVCLENIKTIIYDSL